jgi:putative tricarboxylic transport membrane protein
VPSRRDLLLTTLGAATVAAVGARAQAAVDLEVLVPSGPGGGWDQTARSMEYVMRTDRLVRQYKVEHALGGGGAIGLTRFLRVKKGHGDALMVAGMVMVGALAANKSPVKLTDATPLARLTGEFEVIAVPADSPLKSMRDLVAMFKADPGKVSWVGGSAGGTDHILGGMIARAVGVDPKRVAYVAYAGSGQAQAALLGKQVTCGISGWGEFGEQIKAGKLRALALSSDKRQADIPVPTLKEQGVDVELFNWRGVFAPPGLTAAQTASLLSLIDKMVKGATWRAELKKKDWTDIYLPGAGFGRYVQDETARITRIVADLGLTQ